MSNDLQAQISTRIGNTVSELQKIQAAITQIHSATEKNNQAHRNFQQTASSAFKTAHGQASSYNEKMKEVGHAMSLLGGEAGHLGHMFARIGSVSEQGGVAIGRIAMAAGIASLAIGAYTAMIARHMEQAKRAKEMEDEYREAIMKTQEETGKNASAGLGKADVVGRLLGAGGQGALQQAGAIATRDHIDVEDARKGVLKSYNIKDAKTRKASLEAASLFYQSGAGTFEEGVDAGVKDPAVRAALRGGDVHRAADLARKKAITGRFGGGDIGTLDQAISSNSSDLLMRAHRKQIDDQNATSRSQEKSARDGEGRAESMATAARASSPEATILIEMDKKMQKQIDHQAALAAAQAPVWQAILDLGHFFNLTEGSETSKLWQMERDYGKLGMMTANKLTPPMLARSAAGKGVNRTVPPSKQ